MSKILNRIRDKPMKNIQDYHMFESRISKTLYYVNYPNIDCLSLPLTELAAEVFSESRRGQSLDRLHYTDAVDLSWHACVSPLALVMAVVYLERLKKLNPEYLQKVASSDLFLVSLVVSYKFLCDDGNPDEVFMDEWASSARISLNELKQLERDFLKAIDWQVYVRDAVFWAKLDEIETILARKQGLFRGYFTYTELEKLLTISNLPKHLHIYCLILFITMVTLYITSLLILLSSIMITNQISLQLIDKTDFYHSKNNDNNTTVELATIPRQFNEINYTALCQSNVDFNEIAPQEVSWNWWTVSTLNWLIEISQFTKFDLDTTGFSYFINRRCTSEIILNKIIEKDTATIRDVLGKTWHKKWTDLMLNDLDESVK